jgi:predicted secreted protein
MPAQNGRTLRIMIGDGASPEVFSTIAGVQECGISGEIGEIDITDKDSNGYRTLLAGGIRSLSLSASGVTLTNALMQLFIAGEIFNARMVWEDSGDMIEGAFQMGSFENTGATENAAIMFTAEFRSSGEFEFVEGP